jgi:hypothetical protein
MVETTRIRMNPSMIPRTMVASTPPTRKTSPSPCLIARNAYPRASVEEAHPVVITCEAPRRPNFIDSSEDIVPIVPVEIVCAEAFLCWPV